MNGLLVFIEMKQKKKYIKIKIADSKKPHFPAPPILNDNKQPVHMRHNLFL